jgi:hypothetical protein
MAIRVRIRCVFISCAFLIFSESVETYLFRECHWNDFVPWLVFLQILFRESGHWCLVNYGESEEKYSIWLRIVPCFFERADILNNHNHFHQRCRISLGNLFYKFFDRATQLLYDGNTLACNSFSISDISLRFRFRFRFRSFHPNNFSFSRRSVAAICDHCDILISFIAALIFESGCMPVMSASTISYPKSDIVSHNFFSRQLPYYPFWKNIIQN